MGGITHYGAVLVRLPESDIDSTTAVGFSLDWPLGLRRFYSKYYSEDMNVPVVILAVTFVAVLGVTALFNALGVNPELKVAVWALIMMVGGGAAGMRGDQLPELPSWLTGRRRDG